MEPSSRWSHARTAGRVVWRFLLPFTAMRQTAALAKREAQRTRDNLVVLKSLGADAVRDLVGRKRQAGPANESFSEAFARRGPDAPSIAELRRHFLSRKRITLATAALFGVLALLQVAVGIWHGSGQAMLFGALCLAGGQPLFFIVAFSAQLRIWQLDTHRLSIAERGGVGDLIREVPRWWLVTLDPELSRKERGAS
jgi:hypothetical protein